MAALDPRVEPRVHERDGFVVTLWTYYEPLTPRDAVVAAEYADALALLHASMRELDLPTPHFTDRAQEAQQLVASRELTPALADADRELLGTALQRLQRAVGARGTDQVLHGEPHPGNLIMTGNGLLFIDLETCCRGPVEFDLAHAPDDISGHYPGVDVGLLRDCRTLVLAMITAWRWDRDDQFPDGRQLGVEWLNQIRGELDSGGPVTS